MRVTTRVTGKVTRSFHRGYALAKIFIGLEAFIGGASTGLRLWGFRGLGLEFGYGGFMLGGFTSRKTTTASSLSCNAPETQ